MDAHAGHADVQEHGCWAMRVLAERAEGKLSLVKQSSLPTILRALREHQGHQWVQAEGCGALGSVCVGAWYRPALASSRICRVLTVRGAGTRREQVRAVRGGAVELVSIPRVVFGSCCAVSKVLRNATALAGGGRDAQALGPCGSSQERSDPRPSSCALAVRCPVLTRASLRQGARVCTACQPTTRTPNSRSCAATQSRSVDGAFRCASRFADVGVVRVQAIVAGMKEHRSHVGVQQAGCQVSSCGRARNASFSSDSAGCASRRWRR
eukprot:2084404-Rhodomonas_salina.1